MTPFLNEIWNEVEWKVTVTSQKKWEGSVCAGVWDAVSSSPRTIYDLGELVSELVSEVLK